MAEFVCIVCPNGCSLVANNENGELIVTGARCPKGKAYAATELTNPTRTIASTVRTAFANAPVLPVRTEREIPKGKIFEVMAAINAVTVTKRIGRGDTVIENVL
ncbi:MAG: DUF1667 domain-containing protein, partial [Christensenellaceae bacterium]|nr:DUF1667 domain-containing protein [Christensenellaceae bacterium]